MRSNNERRPGQRGLIRKTRVFVRRIDSRVISLDSFVAYDSRSVHECGRCNLPPSNDYSGAKLYSLEPTYLLGRLVGYDGKDNKHIPGREGIPKRPQEEGREDLEAGIAGWPRQARIDQWPFDNIEAPGMREHPRDREVDMSKMPTPRTPIAVNDNSTFCSIETAGDPESSSAQLPRISYSQDWPSYNEAQQEEIHLFDVLLRDIVEAIPEPGQKMGRPRLPLREQLFCSIQKVYSQLSSRRATGLYQHAAERGQIGHAPHFNTPSKLFNRPDVTPILQELVRLSALPVAGIETDFAIDSTGFRTTSYSAYCGARHGTKMENDWVKAHFCVGTSTNIVAGAVVTDGNGSDTVQFEPLLRRVVEDFQVREVSADMAYLSRSNLQLVTEAGGIPYIPFKKNSIPRSLGASTWKKMYHYFQLHREEFMEHYHKRSNAESTIAAIKRRFGEVLKSKNFIAQKNELLAKVIAYNLTVIIHEMFEHGITPGFLHLKSPLCT